MCSSAGSGLCASRAWKMNESRELFGMSDAPFTEKPVAVDTDASRAARTRLAAVLAELNPAGGKADGAAGKGKGPNKERKKKAAKAG